MSETQTAYTLGHKYNCKSPVTNWVYKIVLGTKLDHISQASLYYSYSIFLNATVIVTQL